MTTVGYNERSVVDVVTQLVVTYKDSLSGSTVTSVVLTARDQLAGLVPGTAFPELLHRLADYRLPRIVAKR